MKRLVPEPKLCVDMNPTISSSLPGRCTCSNTHFSSQGSDSQGSHFWLPPDPQCTRPLWFLLRVVGPLKDWPIYLFWAEPGCPPWLKAWPPGYQLWAPSSGLALVQEILVWNHWGQWWTAFCLTLPLELIYLLRPYHGQSSPGNIAPRVNRAPKLLHHNKVAVIRGKTLPCHTD